MRNVQIFLTTVLLAASGLSAVAEGAIPTYAPLPAKSPPARPVTVNCTSTGLVCDPPFRFDLKVRKGYRVTAMTFTAAKTHCSNMRLRVIVDGVPRPTSPEIPPGGKIVTKLGGLKTGTHRIALRAVGVLGGCNTGRTGSWAGTIRFTVLKRLS